MFQELLISIISIFGVSSLYIYICKYYTIKRVQELEIELSKFEDITDEERNLLNSIRDFLQDPVEDLIKTD